MIQKTSLTIAGLIAAGAAFANPSEAPDFSAALAEEIGGGRLGEVEITHEELERDGLSANYYAEFTAEIVTGRAFYTAVEEGPGYVVVQEVLEADETVSASGNTLGAYTNGAWQVQVNLIDMQMPGGRPFQDFTTADRVALEAGTERLERFLEERGDAVEAVAALQRQELELADREARLETELRLKREVMQREREAEARAAAEIAELEAQQRVQAAEAEAAAERLAARDRATSEMFALFEEGNKFDVEVSHDQRRVGGTMTITGAGPQDAAGTLSLSIGGGATYQTNVVITAGTEPGSILLRRPPFRGFNDSGGECRDSGSYINGADVVELVSITGNNACRGDAMVIRLPEQS